MWCLMSTETIRFIRDGEKWGKGGGDMELGGGGIIYLSLYTVATRMTPALRWAAMRERERDLPHRDQTAGRMAVQFLFATLRLDTEIAK